MNTIVHADVALGASGSLAMGVRAPLVDMVGLTKSYPERRSVSQALRHPFARRRAPVLRGITLSVRRAELFGLLGLNGAGKTTLLKILATLLTPDAGSATIDGLDVVADGADVRARLAMVTADERSLNWRLSALENLRLFAGLHRLAATTRSERIREVLAVVGLSDVREKLVGAFSSGMRQRLLVARALLSRPEILLLDEPTRSLDPLSAHEFRVMLRDTLIAERAVTVILATHNAEEAFSYCDRVAVLHRGTVAAEGSASELATAFARNRYRAWTPTPTHPCFAALESTGMIRDREVPNDATDPSVSFELPQGDSAAARVLRRLVTSGVTIERFERVPLALSGLIARIAETHEALNLAGDVDA